MILTQTSLFPASTDLFDRNSDLKKIWKCDNISIKFLSSHGGVDDYHS